MSTNYSDVRDAIVASLSAVADIGTVHNFRRYVTKADEAATAFSADLSSVTNIAFADVEWTGATLTPEAWQSDGGEQMLGRLAFTCRFYRSLDDANASGRAFATMLDAALRALAVCAAGLTYRQQAVPVTLMANDHRLFNMPGVGAALVHYAEASVSVVALYSV